jgi:CheY-like chemotaxis protein
LWNLASASSRDVISLRGNPKPGQSNAGNGAQEATRKAYELANANSWNEIRLAVKKALAAQLSKPMSKKILLVDDEWSILEALSKVLGAEDYEVVLAENGQDAVEKIAAEPIDLILLDLGLPVKDGWATLEWLARINPLLPVIIITGRSEQRTLAEKAGAYALMEKPLDVPLLLQTIRDLLDEPLESRVRRASDPAHGFRHAHCDGVLLREGLLKRLTTSYPCRGPEIH